MSLNTCQVVHFLRNTAIRLGGSSRAFVHLMMRAN